MNTPTEMTLNLPRNSYERYIRNSMQRGDRDVIVFHHADADGFMAAAAAYVALDPRSEHRSAEASAVVKNVTYIPVNYGYKFEDIMECLKGDHLDVFVLDFAFSAAHSDIIHESVDFFLTLDHHKTNAEELQGKPYAIFDMNASGAKMAFQYFFGPGEAIPLAVTLADNRDMWLKTDGREDAFHEYFLYIQDSFKDSKGTRLLRILSVLIIGDEDESAEEAVDGAIKIGEQFIRRRDAGIRSMASQRSILHTVLGGHPAVLVNAPLDQSDLCEYLYQQDEYKDKIIGAYRILQGGFLFSIRKHADLDIDLSKLAKSHYDGGGHPASAGFRTSFERGIKILQNKEKWCLCWPSDQVDEALSEAPTKMDFYLRLSNIPASLRSRATVETDTRWIQALPYLTVKAADTGKYFVYRRPAGGGESRLYGNTSIGLGGHVDSLPMPYQGLAQHLAAEGSRELAEEVGLVKAISFLGTESVDISACIGFKIANGEFTVIRSKDTDVDSVHLGLAITIVVPDSSYLEKINLEEVQDPRWMTKEELKEAATAGEPFESWTAKLVELM